MPGNWLRQVSENGELSVTNKTTQEQWTVLFDDQGKQYYVNQNTNQSQWHDPWKNEPEHSADTSSVSNEEIQEKIEELNKLITVVEELKKKMDKLNYSDKLTVELQLRINELINSINIANLKSEDLDKKLEELNILKIRCEKCIK